jgi:hypothetical protein
MRNWTERLRAESGHGRVRSIDANRHFVPRRHRTEPSRHYREVRHWKAANESTDRRHSFATLSGVCASSGPIQTGKVGATRAIDGGCFIQARAVLGMPITISGWTDWAARWRSLISERREGNPVFSAARVDGERGVLSKPRVCAINRNVGSHTCRFRSQRTSRPQAHSPRHVPIRVDQLMDERQCTMQDALFGARSSPVLAAARVCRDQ